jgi:hypothetical protein
MEVSWNQLKTDISFYSASNGALEKSQRNVAFFSGKKYSQSPSMVNNRRRYLTLARPARDGLY